MAENNLKKTESEPKISLKKATAEDIPALLSVENSVTGSKIYSAMTDKKEWYDEFKKDGSATYLILKDDTVAGDASYERRSDGSAYIGGLVIMPEFQRQGIGRQALGLILNDLKDVKFIELVTHPENHSAIKLYESFGFVVESEIKNYYGDGEPRIRMILEKE